MPKRPQHSDWANYAAAGAFGVELLHAHFERHVYERHSHEGYAIGVTETGVQAFHCRGALHASRAGIPEGFTYRMLYLPAEAMRDVLRDARDGRRAELPFARAPLIRDPLLARRVQALHQALSEHAPALESEALLRDTCLRFAASHADAPFASAGTVHRPNLAALGRARDVLHASLAEDVTTDELAGVAGMSRFHLCRAF